ncbi:hypothetical protein SDC9_135310 [bioreactor metagenome]|uniref:Uncharacterized protein n=1 Tax=bioreactor metagenome TaxID=1076179 RepID=A0A645DG06_9ZZZZ
MTSMRSRRGLGIVEAEFAVVMNMTLLRSKGTSRKLSAKCQFCSGSSTSSSADDGSPRKSEPNLSISSIKINGLFAPHCFIFWMMRPGSAPTYVRLWPRISASSCIPPSDMLMNFRPIVRAIERPSEVLPTPGGPTKQITCARMLFPARFLTARYSRMRFFTSSRP